MKKFLSFIAIIALVVLSSCNNPLNKKYSEQTFAEDAKAIGESKKLNQEDVQMLAAYIVLSKMGGKDLQGKTYADILKDAKDYKSEQDRLAAQAKKEEEEKRAKLGAALTVAMFDKGYFKEEYQDYLEYKLAFENKTDKEIRAVKGTILITDLFDDKIKSVHIVEDHTIPSHQTYKTSYTTEYNQFIDDDVRLRGKEMKDIKVVWNPEKIIFSDGTSLE